MNSRDIEKANQRMKRLNYIIRHIERASILYPGGTSIQILTNGIPKEGKKVSEEDLVFFSEQILNSSSVIKAIENEIELIKKYIRENI
tara:strand:- start:157 stop:420 length:264 start_codon:yes stop_codon:yes gene_type:complete